MKVSQVCWEMTGNDHSLSKLFNSNRFRLILISFDMTHFMKFTLRVWLNMGRSQRFHWFATFPWAKFMPFRDRKEPRSAGVAGVLGF